MTLGHRVPSRREACAARTPRPKRLRFTDAERRLLTEKGKALGRKRLAEVASLATPETILRWFREIATAKYAAPRIVRVAVAFGRRGGRAPADHGA
jgi:hypothetical protein